VGVFDGRVAIITGAARGLGRDYARRFAADGANVVLADIQGAEAATAAANAEGPKCISLAVDITDRASVAALVEQTLAEFGRIDFLINNAGLWRGMNEAGLIECPDDLWDAAWAVNVTGSLRTYQAVAPVMAAAGFGRIVNVSSIAAVNGGNPYGLTKNAVEHMTRGMAREVGDKGITVNCLSPGISAFEGAKSKLPNFQDSLSGNAVPRIGTTDDLYAGLAYLCSEAAEWVTGQTLRVDGGHGV
jgi:3-oxoacyl-[acyl-carrier protein] reductase